MSEHSTDIALSKAPPPLDESAPPTVVVDDVHLTYRVVGRHAKRGGPAALRRIVMREQVSVREIKAVRGVSLVARRGEAVGLIGPNGSGKSTLLRAIAGLMPPEKGAIFTSGQPSLLGVGAALMGDMTGDRNVELGCLAMGMTPNEVRDKFESIVEFSGIGDFISLPMNTYSSGMAARLRFAIAAAKSHEVLLIDEALATGDAQFRRRSEARIRELREDAGTVFLVSHGLGVVRETCNRAIWLEKGQVVMDGLANDVVDAYEEKYDPDAIAERRAAKEAGAVRGYDEPSSI